MKFFEEDEAEGCQRWQEEELKVGLHEYRSSDVIVRAIKYAAFASKSKGIRNGKRRLRKHWKEVELVKYRSGWHLSKNFPWDIVAQEVLHPIYDKDGLAAEKMLQDLVPILCLPR